MPKLGQPTSLPSSVIIQPKSSIIFCLSFTLLQCLLEKINEQRTRKFSATELDDKLKDVYKLEKQKQNRFKIPVALEHHSGSVQYMVERKIHHLYRMEDWLTDEEVKAVQNPVIV